MFLQVGEGVGVAVSQVHRVVVVGEGHVEAERVGRCVVLPVVITVIAGSVVATGEEKCAVLLFLNASSLSLQLKCCFTRDGTRLEITVLHQ